MRVLKTALLTALLGLQFLLTGMVADSAAAERGRGAACRRGDRLTIQDLDVSPDPLMEGQRIRAWRVRIRLEGNRPCDTEIEIREGRDLVGRARDFTLRPGTNDVEIPPAPNYRFHGREHCFDVVVDLEGTRKQVDADRRFCARQRPGWSLREADDSERRPFPYR